MHKPLAIAGFVLGLAALVLQFALPFTTPGEHGIKLVRFFGSLPVLTNVFLVLVYAAEIWGPAALSVFRLKSVQGLAASAAALTMLAYHLALGGEIAPEGLALVSNVALAYAAPTLFIAFWMVYLMDGSLRLHHVAPWLLYPALYVGWTLLLGTTTGTYPHEVLASGTNVLILLVGFLVLSILAVSLDTEKKSAPHHAAHH